MPDVIELTFLYILEINTVTARSFSWEFICPGVSGYFPRLWVIWPIGWLGDSYRFEFFLMLCQ